MGYKLRFTQTGSSNLMFQCFDMDELPTKIGIRLKGGIQMCLLIYFYTRNNFLNARPLPYPQDLEQPMDYYTCVVKLTSKQSSEINSSQSTTELTGQILRNLLQPYHGLV